ncbi:putative XRE-type DNA-binding protein [Neorhizobium galegae]|uniref:helix-turn-helix domain-containing protein n=1 Tax=Neorhizobium galegae TaxID=399 RepID=UPI001FD899C8|nr:XRE family transcriptional regulator [Neorhizobium galegae]MBP2551609.1 putative XRE-type DNA-binding protein [Neorhizobium galegae]
MSDMRQEQTAPATRCCNEQSRSGGVAQSGPENIKLRSALLSEIATHIKTRNCTQSETARQLGISQPRISDLMRGKVHMFTLDTLVKIAAASGLDVEVRLSAKPAVN